MDAVNADCDERRMNGIAFKQNGEILMKRTVFVQLPRDNKIILPCLINLELDDKNRRFGFTNNYRKESLTCEMRFLRGGTLIS